MRFEIGKFYEHTTGHKLAVLTQVETTLYGTTLISEMTNPDGFMAVDSNEDSAENYHEITRERWMEDFSKEGESPMNQYIGTKLIEAKPMNLKAAEKYLKRAIKPNRDYDDSFGYLVKYPDGYESWSPDYEFDKAYRRTDGMTFGLAIEAMKLGNKVARTGWNNKAMWIAISCPKSQMLKSEGFWNKHSKQFAEDNGGHAFVLPTIIMKTDDNKILMGWLASQTDMLADDWMIIY